MAQSKFSATRKFSLIDQQFEITGDDMDRKIAKLNSLI